VQRIEKTVFVSYRRTTAPWALLIYKALRSEGYDVFIDYQGIASGAFESAIVDNIKSRAHFLALLTRSSLDKSSGSNRDWMRFEIKTAMACERNVVPVTLDGFNFGDPVLAEKITGEFDQLSHYQALRVPIELEYFDAAMDRLRAEFLNVPLEAVTHPTSTQVAELVSRSQAEADVAPAVTPEELSANQWFERGHAASDPAEKVEYYSEAIRLNPEISYAYNNRGAAYAVLGDSEAAIEDYDEAIRLDPNYAAAHCNRGLAHRDLGDFTAAIRDYTEALRLDPEFSTAYSDRGNAHRKLGDTTAAFKDYDEALRLDPENAKVYNNRGNAHSELGDITAAIKDYDEALRLNPDYAAAYTNRGLAHRKLGDTTAAIKDFDEALRLDPEFAPAYFSRGLANGNLGDITAAIEDYDEAIRLDPEQAKYYYNRSLAHSKLGDDDAADRDRKKAIELDPVFSGR